MKQAVMLESPHSKKLREAPTNWGEQPACNSLQGLSADSLKENEALNPTATGKSIMEVTLVNL